MALLAAAAPSLISGLFGLFGRSRDRRAQQEANEAARPVNQVAEWKLAGVNPLMGIQSGAFVPPRAVSIGDGYAEIGHALGSLFQGETAIEKLEKTQLELENELLKKALDEEAREGEPGYSEQFDGLLPLAKPARNAQVSPKTVGDDDWIDPGREVEQAPIVNTSGAFVLDNVVTDMMGGPVTIPGDSEPWGIEELIPAAAIVAGTGAARAAKWAGGKAVEKAQESADIPAKLKDWAKKKRDQAREEARQEKEAWEKRRKQNEEEKKKRDRLEREFYREFIKLRGKSWPQ